MMERVTSVCGLVSGGLDSAVLLHRLLARGQRVLPLYIRCGFIWEAAEVRWLGRLLRAMRSLRLMPLRTLDVPLASTYGSHWSFTGRGVPSARSADRAVYLPGRNALLITHAAMVCAQQGIPTVALGTLPGNPFGDATPRFFTQFARCLTQALQRPVRVISPLRRSTKPQLIRSARGAPLELTFSCLLPRGHRHCGRCNKCAERQRAFRQAGVTDPTAYRSRAPLSYVSRYA